MSELLSIMLTGVIGLLSAGFFIHFAEKHPRQNHHESGGDGSHGCPSPMKLVKLADGSCVCAYVEEYE